MAKQTQFQKGVAWLKKQRAKGKGKKRVTPGIAGRIGGFLIGVVPPIVPVPGVISHAQELNGKNVGIGSLIEVGMKEYINGLSSGVGFGDIFKGVRVVQKNGRRDTNPSPVGNGETPRGSTWQIWGTGAVYMTMDKLANFLNSGRGQKFPGTNINAIRSG